MSATRLYKPWHWHIRTELLGEYVHLSSDSLEVRLHIGISERGISQPALDVYLVSHVRNSIIHNMLYYKSKSEESEVI